MYVFNSRQKWLNIIDQLFPLLKYDKQIIICHFSNHTLYQPSFIYHPLSLSALGWYHDIGLIKGMIWKMPSICINTSKIPLAGFNSTGERAPNVGVGELFWSSQLTVFACTSLRPAGSNVIIYIYPAIGLFFVIINGINLLYYDSVIITLFTWS